MVKWINKSIGEIGRVITGNTPPTAEHKYWEHNDYPFVTPSDIKGFDIRYNYQTERYISKEWLKKSGDLLPKDTICFVCIGSTIGKMCLLKEPSFTNQQINSIICFDNYDSKYIYYALRNIQKDVVNNFGGGGAVKEIINKSTFEKIQILIPTSLIEQKSISKILSSLDDKIELNNKMSRTLEKIAQAIFKHWFIDFEFPDENGKPYKSSGGKMVDSEMGKIPEGWKVVMLENVVIRNKKAMRKKEEWENKKIIDLSVMPNFSMIINTFNEGKNFKTNIYELNEYDILFGSIRPYFGKAGFSPIKGAITGTVYSFKPNDDSLFSYILLNITNKNFIDYTIQYSRGTKMPIINWDDIIKYRILMPNNKTLINNFEKLVKPLIVQIKENILQNQTLSQLRDSLLPRLMSGKISL